MGMVAELADYDETLYKIEGKGSEVVDKDDKINDKINDKNTTNDDDNTA